MDEDIFRVPQLEVKNLEYRISGHITEKEKFKAAKQILLGLAILYTLTLFIYLYNPKEASKLIDICTTTFPPLATMIIVFYFRNMSPQ